MSELKKVDLEIFEAVQKETNRQQYHLELIASENFVSKSVLEAQGSVLTNKYAEGYAGKRNYGGCEYIDEVENIAKDRLKKLFNVKFVNVQPHSGSQANMGAYRAILKPNDKILGMALDHGGHLTHGYKLSFSGQDYQSFFYGVSSETEMIDYDEVERIALEVKPNVIVAGASAYPRQIDFKRFKEIADKVGALLMVDMAHIAGLVAAGLHQNPCDYADIETSTTHKTIRGPRGGIILTNNEEIAKKVDKNVFPGIQGGPLMHVICAKAVAFKEALSEEFNEYQNQVIKNSKVLADTFIKLGYHVISNGTDNHLLLLDVKSKTGLNGKQAEELLGRVNITVNKNTIPNDTEKPFLASGIRIGTPAITTRGFKEEDMVEIAQLIDKTLNNNENDDVLESVKEDVISMCKNYPLNY